MKVSENICVFMWSVHMNNERKNTRTQSTSYSSLYLVRSFSLTHSRHPTLRIRLLYFMLNAHNGRSRRENCVFIHETPDCYLLFSTIYLSLWILFDRSAAVECIVRSSSFVFTFDSLSISQWLWVILFIDEQMLASVYVMSFVLLRMSYLD